jgi:Pvc16 N-terminal domain
MANHNALAAIPAAIRGLLHERYPRDQFGPNVKIATVQPKDIESLTDDGIAILLWRISMNTQRRALAPRTDLLGRRFKAPLPVDVSLLIIPHANNSAETQLKLAGWAMRALADAGPISSSQLNNYLAEEDVFAETEEVELVCDPLSLTDYLSLWDRLKKFPLSVNYLARMTLIDSQQQLTESAPVIERQFEMGTLAQ